MKTLILTLSLLVSIQSHATVSKQVMHNMQLAAEITAKDVEGDRYSSTLETLESASLAEQYPCVMDDSDSVTPYDNEGGD